MNLIKRYITRNPCYQANVNKADSRYTTFQKRGPLGLMLHSVGCAQPNALVFINKWDNENYDKASIHGVIDANTGTVYQTMPWNFRAWHCGGSANDTHVGVEMCESKYIRYIGGAKFEILDRTKAVADCVRTYHAAVELFAMLCSQYNLNPMMDICSHKEGGKKGIASGHVDPEHYWTGLGMPYTMNGFRNDVKQKMEDTVDMIVEEVKALVHDEVQAAIGPALAQLSKATTDNITSAVNTIVDTVNDRIESIVTEHTGKKAADIDNVNKWIRPQIQKLLDAGVINGGTTAEVNPNDVNMYGEDLRVLAVLSKYIDQRIKEVENQILIKSE